MRALLFAYHDVGCEGLKTLREMGHEIAAVFTHEDDANENVWFGSVKKLATDLGAPVYTPESLQDPEWIKKIKALRPDAIFSFYYRSMIRDCILAIPPKGAYNLHGSLLPKYRGRAPVNWVLVKGERETGLTLHHMVAKPDAGDIVAQRSVFITEDDTALTLYRKLTPLVRPILLEAVPLIDNGTAPRVPQDPSKATYFGGRKPEDGKIDWIRPAREIYNLIRAVTHPYPGAFTQLDGKRVFIWRAKPQPGPWGQPGSVSGLDPLTVRCGSETLRIERIQSEGGPELDGSEWAKKKRRQDWYNIGSMKILIVGVNGFIGNALTERILGSTDWEIYGMDLSDNRLTHSIRNPRFHFVEGDISINKEWIEYHIKKCDVVLPLVAIATPATYVKDPIRVFELDFEENLKIVRACQKYRKRILFPSTSEVYGMCQDKEFDEDESPLVMGPIRMQRWIYACSKQLLDRVIWAYGAKEGLRFTLFRPFNWVGPKLDSLQTAKEGSSRVVTQFIGNLVKGEPISLVNGGHQKRAFTYLDDGIDCLVRIIENKRNVCDGQIFNIGNPKNELSIAGLAKQLRALYEKHPLRDKSKKLSPIKIVREKDYYGQGYQDIGFRMPSIKKAQKLLGWTPKVDLETSLRKTLDYFLKEEAHAK